MVWLCIPQLKYILYYTKKATVGQKLAKIDYILWLYELVTVFISVHIMNTLVEPVPTIPHTPQTDLKCLRNTGGRTRTPTFIYEGC